MAGEYKSDSAPLYDEQAIVRPRPVVTASSPTRNGGGGGVPAMNGYASANGVPPSPGARSSASSSRATSPRIRADNPTQEGEVSMDSHSIHATLEMLQVITAHYHKVGADLALLETGNGSDNLQSKVALVSDVTKLKELYDYVAPKASPNRTAIAAATTTDGVGVPKRRLSSADRNEKDRELKINKRRTKNIPAAAQQSPREGLANGTTRKGHSELGAKGELPVPLSPQGLHLEMMGLSHDSIERHQLLADATQTFIDIDTDHSGTLSYEEVFSALEDLGYTSTVARQSFLADFKFDLNNNIEIEEFKNGYLRKESRSKALTATLAKKEKKLIAEFDSLQETEEHLVIGDGKGVIDPTIPISTAWDLLVTFFLCTTIITMPLSLGFDRINDALFDWNAVVDFIFITDVVKQFHTGFINSHGFIILDKKKIQSVYFRSWFFPDLFSSIPIDAIFRWTGTEQLAEGAGDEAQMLKAIRTVRMAKIFRLFRVGRTVKYFKAVKRYIESKMRFRISDGAVQMLQLLAMVLTIAHWIGCLNFYTAQSYGFPEGSWSDYFMMDELEMWKQYTLTVWRALDMLIMLDPDGGARCRQLHKGWCMAEYWMTIATYYLGAVLFSVLVSNLSSIIMSKNISSRNFEERMQIVNEYMKSCKLPIEIQENVHEYYHLTFKDGQIFGNNVLDELTPQLRRQIVAFNSKEIMEKVPLFAECETGKVEQALLAQLLASMQNHHYFVGEAIMEEGTTADNIFFISSGILEIWTMHHLNGPINLVGSGCYVGDVAVILDRPDRPVKRTATVRAKTCTLLYFLHKDVLLPIINDYPELHNHMESVAEARLDRMQKFDPMNRKDGKDMHDEMIVIEDTEDMKTTVIRQNFLSQHVNISAEAYFSNPSEFDQ